MTLHVTALSTAQDDQERARRLGDVMWQKTKKLLDQLDAQKPDADHARAVRTADLEALITSAICEKLAILQSQHQRFRTSTVLSYLEKRNQHQPTRALVQRVLKKHGLYT